MSKDVGGSGHYSHNFCKNNFSTNERIKYKTRSEKQLVILDVKQWTSENIDMISLNISKVGETTGRET